MSDVATPHPAPKLVGASISRVDARRKVTGQADYTADYHFARQAWAVAVKSTIAKGRIIALDTAAAEKSPGVVAVYTWKNRPKIYPPLKETSGFMVAEKLAPLGDETIHYYGQDIAFVVAETYEQAREAAGLVRPTYAAEPAVARFSEPKREAPGKIYGEKPHLEKKAPGTASVTDAWEASPARIDATYITPMIHHQPMEPHAAIAKWHTGRLTFYAPVQWMYGARNFLAAGLAVPAEDVRVISHFVGGAFGCKGSSWMFMLVIAAAARDLDRPVKFVMERENMFTSVGHRPRTSQRVQLGADAAGKLQAMRHFTESSASEAGLFVEAAGHRATGVMYGSPNIEIDHQIYKLSVSAPTFMRAPGESPGVHALETAMDELAVALKMDPVQLRLVNMTANHPMSGLPFSSRHLDECYRVAGEKFGWARRAAAPRATREGDWWVGWGMASASYAAHRSNAQARVRLLADGTAEVACASHDLGTGTYTIMTQTAADELGLPLEKVSATLGDSTLPEAPFSGGSQSAGSILPAVQMAARSVLTKLKTLAAADAKSPLAGLAADDLEAAEGGLRAKSNPSRRVAFAAIFEKSGEGALEATEKTEPAAETKDKREQPSYSPKTTAYQSYGAFFVEVHVHRLTGETRVKRVVTAMDIGQPLNLKTARSQILGGAVFGIGAALTEHSLFDENSGAWITQDLGTYHVPVNADVPEIDVTFVGPPDFKFNSVGARGIGEIGNTGISAAIGNAIYHATGVRVRELPFTTEKILGGLSHEGAA
ncbi:MAG: aromatic aldehyde oxidoreductase molybdenum-binding subunit [Verrucomicrobia bacterium]|nr:aromatic aldehyde oxidoreductase molybdenum-binding subunit [Verrucomicrobiota bacterium]